ncbi:hypothetical protein GOP47_0002066 [Adiantum capillus-veneris]|uniref:Uncharacterized protein n=1 Tax=Adiantum capillus-veneris TaxID=13818 RepID=A0A9D4VAZ8_ADICA|nr:hypothetical protein GOP47_0002066 [Adiantum capillus-veneris]
MSKAYARHRRYVSNKEWVEHQTMSIGCITLKCTVVAVILKIASHRNCLFPVYGRQLRLSKHGASSIEQSEILTLYDAILLRVVGDAKIIKYATCVPKIGESIGSVPTTLVEVKSLNE